MFRSFHCSVVHSPEVCCQQYPCTPGYHLVLASSWRLHIPSFLFHQDPLLHIITFNHGMDFHFKIFISRRRNGKDIIFQQVRFVICVHHILCYLCSCLHVGLLADYIHMEVFHLVYDILCTVSIDQVFQHPTVHLIFHQYVRIEYHHPGNNEFVLGST